MSDALSELLDVVGEVRLCDEREVQRGAEDLVERFCLFVGESDLRVLDVERRDGGWALRRIRIGRTIGAAEKGVVEETAEVPFGFL